MPAAVWAPQGTANASERPGPTRCLYVGSGIHACRRASARRLGRGHTIARQKPGGSLERALITLTHQGEAWDAS